MSQLMSLVRSLDKGKSYEPVNTRPSRNKLLLLHQVNSILGRFQQKETNMVVSQTVHENGDAQGDECTNENKISATLEQAIFMHSP